MPLPRSGNGLTVCGALRTSEMSLEPGRGAGSWRCWGGAHYLACFAQRVVTVWSTAVRYEIGANHWRRRWVGCLVVSVPTVVPRAVAMWALGALRAAVVPLAVLRAALVPGAPPAAAARRRVSGE